MPLDVPIGTSVAGYRVERLLGSGAAGVVYLARDEHLNRPVALKLLPPGLAQDARFRARFVRESQLAAGLEHPAIVPIYGAGEADGLLYLAMRFVDGGDLRELIVREGRLEPERAIERPATPCPICPAAPPESHRNRRRRSASFSSERFEFRICH